MSFAIFSSDDFLEPSTEMGFDSELKTSSKQKNYIQTVNERDLSPHVKHSSKNRDKLKFKNHVDQPNGALHYQLAQDAAMSSGNQHMHSNRGITAQDVEIIKHMSNLPRYLRRVDVGENLQGKALNVGVLDWTRLEKWKSKQKYASSLGRFTSFTSCDSSTSSMNRTTGSFASSSSTDRDRLAVQHLLPRSSLVSSGERISQCVQSFQSSDAASKSTLDGHKHEPPSFEAVGRSHSRIILDKEKMKHVVKKSEIRNASDKMKHFGVSNSLSSKEEMSSWDGGVRRNKEGLSESHIRRKNIDKKIISEHGSCDASLRLKEDIACDIEGKKSVEPGLGNHRAHNSIVLLLPKDLSRRESPAAIHQSPVRTLSDKNLAQSNKNKPSSGISTKDINATELPSEISNLCTQSSFSVVRERTSVTSHTFQGSDKVQDHPCLDERAEKKKSDITPMNLGSLDMKKISDQETTELAATKGRHPSPNNRFSFSLGRLGRSLSFKEGSDAPQLPSTHVSFRSGPIFSDASGSVDNLKVEKAKGHNRARSSPLRRLLDPLLKHKEVCTLPSNETNSSLKGSLKTSGPLCSYSKEKQEAYWVRALLQLTVKNGLPLFKFVVDSNDTVLLSTMKNLTSSGKDDSGRNYTFYSVNEIKRKSGGWISQGSKAKSGGYAYNVVGQMKVSSSEFSRIGGLESERYMVRESVLLGVELKQGNDDLQKFIPNRELAAAIVKVPCKNSSLHEQPADKNLMEKCFVKSSYEDLCSYNTGEDAFSNSSIVILPDGIHTTPKDGKPSPLIDRWKSGGLCDCGGWDVGCKLRVISNENKCPKAIKTLEASPNSDRLELFIQVVLYCLERKQCSCPIISFWFQTYIFVLLKYREE